MYFWAIETRIYKVSSDDVIRKSIGVANTMPTAKFGLCNVETRNTTHPSDDSYSHNDDHDTFMPHY